MKMDAKPPQRFTTPVDVRFSESWHLDGHIRTGEQALEFSDEIVTTTPEIVVHWFQFEFDSVLYEFKLVGPETEGVNTNDDMIAMIAPLDLTKCWMNGHELAVHPWEPDDE